MLDSIQRCFLSNSEGETEILVVNNLNTLRNVNGMNLPKLRYYQ